MPGELHLSVLLTVVGVQHEPCCDSRVGSLLADEAREAMLAVSERGLFAAGSAT